jgi:acetylornithine/N-succinyldiaminopimelate aminotransferase
LSGIAVSTLGHGHPKLVAAIAAQAGRMLHTSNLYTIREQEQLSDKLAELSGMQEIFFCNSGCEANEAAIKLARFYGHKKGIDNPTIIVMEKAFHGRTMATLSATGNRKAQAGFEPLVSGFVRVPYDDLEAIRTVAEHNKNIVAVMLEIVQGEGGIHLASIEYQKGLRKLCDEQGWLLICDEVQCGMARTGKWFGYQHAGIQPDVATLAKGLGSGVPIGACMVSGKAAGLFGPGNHGSTFGGNPLACTAALTTIETIKQDGLMANAERVGALIRQLMAEALAGMQGRGRDSRPWPDDRHRAGSSLWRTGWQGAGCRAMLINVTADKVIRFLPSLIFSENEAKELVDRITPLIKEFLAA